MSQKALDAISESATIEADARNSLDALIDGVDADDLAAELDGGGRQTDTRTASSEADDDYEDDEDLDAEADLPDLDDDEDGEEDEEEGDEEAEEESDEDDEDEDEEPRQETRAERRRRKILEEETPKIREQVLAEERERLKPIAERISAMEAEHAQRGLQLAEQQLIMASANGIMDLYEQALKGAGVDVGPQVAVMKEKLRADLAEHRSELKKNEARAQQAKQKTSQEDVRKQLRWMAEGAGVDPDRFQFEYALALKKGERVSPTDVLKRMKGGADAPRNGSGKKKRRRPRVLRSGGGGGGGGAPPADIGLDSSVEDTVAFLQEEEAKRAKRRAGRRR